MQLYAYHMHCRCKTLKGNACTLTPEYINSKEYRDNKYIKYMQWI